MLTLSIIPDARDITPCTLPPTTNSPLGLTILRILGPICQPSLIETVPKAFANS